MSACVWVYFSPIAKSRSRGPRLYISQKAIDSPKGCESAQKGHQLELARLELELAHLELELARLELELEEVWAAAQVAQLGRRPHEAVVVVEIPTAAERSLDPTLRAA